MKTKTESIKKFFLIGLSLFLFKSVLIVYAYIFNQKQSNLFNQSYYTASLLILFASFGFHISQTRIPIKTLMLFLFVTVNTLITYSVLQLISKPFSNITEIIPVILYCIFVSAGGVLNFKLLFDGKYKNYFWVMLMFACAHYLIVPFVLVFNTTVFPVLSVIIIIWFFVVYRLFDKDFSDNKNYKEYFKVGFSAFVINSAVSLGLTGDKFIVNHFFTTDIANTYTFSWGLTAPIFYIGSLIEKYLYAEPKFDKKFILKKGILFSFLLITTYIVGIITLINFFPHLLPGYISIKIFKNIFILMIVGYSIYVILHYPLNTYLFKVIDIEKQKTISIFYTIIILIFSFLFYYFANHPSFIDYKILLITVWIYITLLLIIKALIIFYVKNGNSIKTEDAIIEEYKGIP